MPIPTRPGVPPHRPRPAVASVAAASLALLLSACGLADAGEGEVVFAVAAPLHDAAGNPNPIGQSTEQGAQLAAKQINAGGGIGGRALTLVVHDDSANKDAARAVARRIVADGRIVAVAGHVNSGNTFAVGDIYADAGVPAVATSSTAAIISQLGEWTYRIASSDAHNAQVLARHALGISPRAAVLYENNDFGMGLGRAFADAYRKAGGTVVESDPFVDAAEVGPYLDRIRGRGVRLVFIGGLDRSAATIISLARARGMDAVFMGSSALEKLDAANPAFAGTQVGMLYHPGASAAAGRFAEDFRAEYGRAPDSFAACAYDAVMLLAAAAKANGAASTAIRDYLRSVGRPGGAPPFVGAAGEIRFDENGDPLDKAYVIGTVGGGRITLAGTR
jgi:branched-chain amino acid transport system substrate-binding protein